MSDTQKVRDSLTSNRDAIREEMIKTARNKDLITYSDLFVKYGVDLNDPGHHAVMSEFLGALGREEHAAGRPMLTSVIVSKANGMTPSEGFYTLAKALGYSVKNSEDAKLEFFTQQIKDTHKYYASETHS